MLIASRVWGKEKNCVLDRNRMLDGLNTEPAELREIRDELDDMLGSCTNACKCHVR